MLQDKLLQFLAAQVDKGLIDLGFPMDAMTTRYTTTENTTVKVPRVTDAGELIENPTNYSSTASPDADLVAIDTDELVVRMPFNPSDREKGWKPGDFVNTVADKMSRAIMAKVVAAIPTANPLDVSAATSFTAKEVSRLSGQVDLTHPHLLLDKTYFAELQAENTRSFSPETNRDIWGFRQIHRNVIPMAAGQVGAIFPRGAVYCASALKTVNTSGGARVRDITLPQTGIVVRVVEYTDNNTNSIQFSMRVNFGCAVPDDTYFHALTNA